MQYSDRKIKIEQWLEEYGIKTLAADGIVPWGERWRGETSGGTKVAVLITPDGGENVINVMRQLSDNNSSDVSYACPKVYSDNPKLGITVYEDLDTDQNIEAGSISRPGILGVYGAIQAQFAETKSLENVMPRTLACDLVEQVMQRVSGTVEGDETNLFEQMPGDEAANLRANLIERRKQLEAYAVEIDAAPATINHTNLGAGNFHIRSNNTLCFRYWDDAVLASPGWSLFLPFRGVCEVYMALSRREELHGDKQGMNDMRAMDAYLGVLRRSIAIEGMDRVSLLPKAAAFGLLHHVSTYFAFPTTDRDKDIYGEWLKDQLVSLLKFLELDASKIAPTSKDVTSVPIVTIDGVQDALDAAQIFRKNGALVIRNAISMTQIEEMREELKKTGVTQENVAESARALEVGHNRYMISPQLDGPFGDPKVIASPSVLRVLDMLFNMSGYILGSATVIHSFPGSKAQLMHRDNVDIFPEIKNMNTPPYLVSVVIPLVPLDEIVGGTQVVLRSHIHRDPEEPTAPRLLPDVSVGDAFLMDSRLLHRGMPNLGDSMRPIYIMCYQRQWYRDFQNFSEQPACAGAQIAVERLPEQRRVLLNWSKSPLT